MRRVNRREALLTGSIAAGAIATGFISPLVAAPRGIPPLQHPLNGKGVILLGFGADWSWATGCDGQVKKHAGVDIGYTTASGMNIKGTDVVAAADGKVALLFTDAKWKSCVILEHTDGAGKRYTTTYWHVDATVTNGQTVKKGVKIGTVADLNGLTTNHLHWGLRLTGYSAVSQRGALPRSMSCGTNDPQWPEWFVRPI